MENWRQKRSIRIINNSVNGKAVNGSEEIEQT